MSVTMFLVTSLRSLSEGKLDVTSEKRDEDSGRDCNMEELPFF